MLIIKVDSIYLTFFKNKYRIARKKENSYQQIIYEKSIACEFLSSLRHF